jgi:hypothetical protein
MSRTHPPPFPRRHHGNFKKKSRANTAYDVNLKSYHRLLITKSGLLPRCSATSTFHKVTRPDTTTVDSPHEVIAAVHSHFDEELSRATPPELPIPPWENPQNPEPFVLAPRGDPFITLTDMMARDTFDQTVSSLGAGRAFGPYGIPTEMTKFLPNTDRSALFSLVSLFAHKAYTPPTSATTPLAYCTEKVTRPSSTTTAPSPS